MKESFKIQPEGDKFRIIQRTVDVRDGNFLVQIYDELERKIAMIQAQMDSLPRQKEIMEADIKTLKKRLVALEPHVRPIKEKEELRRKAEKNLNKENEIKTSQVQPSKGKS